MIQHEMANREMRRKRGDVITIVTESLPITAIQSYVILQAEGVTVVTIVTLLFASLVLGAKVSGLGMYKTARLKKEECEREFQKTFGVVEHDDAIDGGELGGMFAIKEVSNEVIELLPVPAYVKKVAAANQVAPGPSENF